MQKHIIYITTDSNRLYLEAGYCQDIALHLFELHNSSSNFMNHTPKLSRIVHTEEFASFEEAQKRKAELNTFTRMQKERIIRKYNPNWLNIAAASSSSNIKKAVVYA